MSTQDDSSKSKKRWEPPSPEELQAALPKYEILSLLGRGGMGAVYKGVQCSINRIVAIKILPPGLDETGDGSFAERFKNEARSMGTLSHPGIVRVFDFGQSFGGILYFVMEFIEGRDVGEWIKEAGRLPPEQALAITAHVCDALQYAHERGIIHRDIKPANIMVGQDGRVRVADFGLAKAAHQNLGLTMSNYIVGTPHYLAPECYLDGPVDSRIDLYALGVTLYAMLTGKVPRGIPEMPSKVVPGLDPRWDEIVSKAMMHDPEDRYQTAAEMRSALEILAEGQSEKISAPAAKGAGTGKAPPRKSDSSATGSSTRRSSVGAAKKADSGIRPQTGLGRADSDAKRPKSSASRRKSGTDIAAILGILAIVGGGAWIWRSSVVVPPQTSEPIQLIDPPENQISTPPPTVLVGPHEKANTLDMKPPEPTTDAVASSSGTSPSPPPVASTIATPPVITPEVAETKDSKAFTNSLGMKFVPVPGTEVHFCTHEVRWKDYAAYAKENPGIDSKWKNQTHNGFELTERADEHPVVFVSWEDAKRFCDWLSQKEGQIYRLPSDREWSHAVGLNEIEQWTETTSPETVTKSRSKFPWGEQWPPPTGSGNFGDRTKLSLAPKGGDIYLTDYTDGFPTTAPSQSFPPNAFGIHDLSGNVWEWVEDQWNAERGLQVLRGGSWRTGDRLHLLSSDRALLAPIFRDAYYGFRIATDRSKVVPSSAPNSGKAQDPKTVPTTQNGKLPNPAPLAVTMSEPFTNSLGMKFVPVPGTEVHFCIHETRRKDYAVYAAENPAIDNKWETPSFDGFTITDRLEDHPTVHVSWEDAKAFCEWLSKREGKTYRLPTDQEWSLAVGIGHEEDWKDGMTPTTVLKSQDAFPWSEEWPPPKGAGNYSDESRRAKAPREDAKYLEGYDDEFPATAPVMSFEANKLGLFDLGGNVWEWCEDLSTGEQDERVIRGASWHGNARGTLLSSNRSRAKPEYRHNCYGFRVIVEAATTPSTLPAQVPPVEKAELPPGSLPPDPDAPRHWTSSDGKTITARFGGMKDGSTVLLQVGDRSTPYPINRLAPESQKQAWNLAAAFSTDLSTRSRAVVSPAATIPEPIPATKDQPFENSLGMKFVPVPGTAVLFCIHETRYMDFEEFAKVTSDLSGNWKRQNYDQFVITDRPREHPVTNVNWDDAKAFCTWISDREGRKYRLPTDSEWSTAIGLGEKEIRYADDTPRTLSQKVPDVYPWGTDWPPPAGAGNYGDSSREEKAPWGGGRYVEGGYHDGFPTTAPVMSFAPNALGLFDLGGNVKEWCEDWVSDEKFQRVMRGGAWDDYERAYLQSSYRAASTPRGGHNERGFRLVLETEVIPPVKSTSMSMGRLRGWVADPSKFPIDLDEAKDITDIVAIDCKAGHLAAIRSGGRIIYFKKQYPLGSKVPTYSLNTVSEFDERPVEGLKFCRSGDQLGVISTAGEITLPKLTKDVLSDPPADGVSEAILFYKGPVILKRLDSSLVTGSIGYKGLANDWTRLPSKPKRGSKAIAASETWAAALTLDGELVVWDKEGTETEPLRGSQGLVDVGAAGERVFVLSADGKVMIVVSPDSREAEKVVFENVAWIKSDGASLLCGMRDGSLATDAETAIRLAGIKGVLHLAKNLPPEAVTLGELGLFWIETVGPNP